MSGSKSSQGRLENSKYFRDRLTYSRYSQQLMLGSNRGRSDQNSCADAGYLSPYVFGLPGDHSLAGAYLCQLHCLYQLEGNCLKSKSAGDSDCREAVEVHTHIRPAATPACTCMAPGDTSRPGCWYDALRACVDRAAQVATINNALLAAVVPTQQ